MHIYTNAAEKTRNLHVHILQHIYCSGKVIVHDNWQSLCNEQHKTVEWYSWTEEIPKEKAVCLASSPLRIHMAYHIPICFILFVYSFIFAFHFTCKEKTARSIAHHASQSKKAAVMDVSYIRKGRQGNAQWYSVLCIGSSIYFSWTMMRKGAWSRCSSFI